MKMTLGYILKRRSQTLSEALNDYTEFDGNINYYSSKKQAKRIISDYKKLQSDYKKLHGLKVIYEIVKITAEVLDD